MLRNRSRKSPSPSSSQNPHYNHNTNGNNMGQSSSSSSNEASPLIGNHHNGSGNDNAKGNQGDLHTRIQSMRSLMQQTHISRANFRLEWRLEQLSNLEKLVEENWEEMVDALQQDLAKGRTESVMAELNALKAEIACLKANVKNWMQPQPRVSGGSMVPAWSYVTPLPQKGPACLVIGPSNYPLSISLMAVAGSLAAGNPTVLKPSELCHASLKLLAETIPKYFGANVLQVVEGSVPETTALLEYDWGVIHFTGSERVGKIVAAAAAKTLTPTVLELGGKCPVLVDETCASDLTQIANRIVWGKLVNCGQNCISPDYLIVHKSKAKALIPLLTEALQQQYGNDPAQSNLGKLVATTHVQRQIDLLKEVEARAKSDSNIRVLCGGSEKCDIDQKYVAPTWVLNPPHDCRLMQEEIFGPLLPIKVVDSRQQAIELIESMQGTPLALYVFTKSQQVFTDLTETCRSGTAVRNDCMFQFAGPHVPFGGLGTSGMGQYRGEYSFRCFSHYLPTIYRPVGPLIDMRWLRYHPYVPWKSIILESVVPRLPDIPTLKWVTRSVMAVVAGAVLSFLFPSGTDSIRHGLAQLLRGLANALSP